MLHDYHSLASTCHYYLAKLVQKFRLNGNRRQKSLHCSARRRRGPGVETETNQEPAPLMQPEPGIRNGDNSNIRNRREHRSKVPSTGVESKEAEQAPHVKTKSSRKGLPYFVWVLMALVGSIGCLSTLLIPAGNFHEISTARTGCPYMPDDSVAGMGWIQVQQLWSFLVI